MTDAEYAIYYCCHPRTIARLRESGVKLHDVREVAVALAESKNPAPWMVDRTIEILEQETADE